MVPKDDNELDELIASLMPQHPASALPPVGQLDHIIQRAERRQRRRRLRLALPVVPLAAGLATAGALALRPSPAVDQASLQVSCAADLTLNRTYTQEAQSPDPVGDCARAWAAGLVVEGQRTVPPLAACIVAGEIRVYPSANACAVLSFPPFSGYSTTQLAALSLNKILQTYDRTGPTCRSASEVVGFVRSQLAILKLTGWTVLTRSDPVCQGITVSLRTKTVLIG